MVFWPGERTELSIHEFSPLSFPYGSLGELIVVVSELWKVAASLHRVGPHHLANLVGHTFLQLDRRQHLAIRPILQNIHELFRIVAARHLQLVSTVIKIAALLLRVPALAGYPA